MQASPAAVGGAHQRRHHRVGEEAEHSPRPPHALPAGWHVLPEAGCSCAQAPAAGCTLLPVAESRLQAGGLPLCQDGSSAG